MRLYSLDLSDHFSSLDACCAHFNMFFILLVETAYLCASLESVATVESVYVSFALQRSIQST